METNAVFATFTLGALVALIPVIGAVALLVPFLMPKNECFAVTVPDSAIDDPVLRGYKRRYAAVVGAVTVVFTVLGALTVDPAQSGTFAVVMMVATLLLSLGSYGLMLFFRSKVKAYKEQQGWKAQAGVTVAAVGAEPAPKPLSMKWDLLYLPLIAITTAMGLLGYNAMPDMVAMHMDFNGETTDMVPKSIAIALMPAIIVTFLAAVLTFCHWTIVRSKKPSDPSIPAASAWAYGMFAHAQSMLLVGLGLLLSLIGPIMVLALVGTIALTTATTIILVLALVAVVASLGVSVVYGQNGSRLIARMQESGEMLQDNDRCWKAGIFYWNPDDPSLFLPERFGIGWTCNWARPAVWGILLGFIAVLVVFVAVMVAIAG